jgi:hypothetical protein
MNREIAEEIIRDVVDKNENQRQATKKVETQIALLTCGYSGHKSALEMPQNRFRMAELAVLRFDSSQVLPPKPPAGNPGVASERSGRPRSFAFTPRGTHTTCGQPLG